MRICHCITLLVFLILPLTGGCKRNHYRVNVSAVKADISIKRLEIDLFETDPEEIVDSIPRLKEKYGGFLQLFSYVINTGKTDDPAFPDNLLRFCTDRLNNEVYSEVLSAYPDIKTIETELGNAFRHYLNYFPDGTLPMVFTCMTGFNNSIIAGDSILGIGLERYLGRNYEYYPRLQIYKYIAARMNNYNIVPDCMYAWGATEWDFEELNYPADNVISRIVHEGKLRYFVKCMIPEIADSVLFGFNAGQLRFCSNNEGQMWQYLVENKLLFSTDLLTIRKLTGEAPFTSYFTNESPGRAATWTGFRIVESYMMKNKLVKLGDLMRNTDYQEILEKARYNP